MNVLRHKWITVLAIAVVAIGALWLWQRSKEPRYQGWTVRQWIKVARPSKTFYTNSQGVSYTVDYNRKELQRMLDKMGSNAGPSLIQILDEGDSLMDDLKRMIARSKWATASMKSAASAGLGDSLETLAIASHAIHYLGSNAVHVIPDLERIICDPEKTMAAYSSASALAGLGFQALPALRRSLTNAPSAQQQMIRMVIQRIYADALQSGDTRNREDAALELSECPRPPFEIIPILADVVDGNDKERRKRALRALGKWMPELAPIYRSARKAIDKAAQCDDADTRLLANEVLAKLPDPNAP